MIEKSYFRNILVALTAFSKYFEIFEVTVSEVMLYNFKIGRLADISYDTHSSTRFDAW